MPIEERLKQINDEPDLIIKADKTDFYKKMTPNDYNDLVEKNIYKACKKSTPMQVNEINNEVKEIADELRIANPVDVIVQCKLFITLKDHKPNFDNALKCCRINPRKSELGKASKLITDKVIKKVGNN